MLIVGSKVAENAESEEKIHFHCHLDLDLPATLP